MVTHSEQPGKQENLRKPKFVYLAQSSRAKNVNNRAPHASYTKYVVADATNQNIMVQFTTRNLELSHYSKR
jgi:hypothetical protein